MKNKLDGGVDLQTSVLGRDRYHAIDVDACDNNAQKGDTSGKKRRRVVDEGIVDVEAVDDSDDSAEDFIPFLKDSENEDDEDNDDDENDDDEDDADDFLPFEPVDCGTHPAERMKRGGDSTDTYNSTPSSSRLLYLEESVAPLLTKSRTYLERKWGVALCVGDDSIEITSGDPTITEVAAAELAQIMSQPDLLETELRGQHQQLIHVFVDESNIFVGAQSLIQPNGQKTRDTSIRMNVPALVDVILNHRQPIQRVVFGSRSSVQEPVEWKEWRAAEFVVHGERRLRGRGETFVDDACAAMVNAAILRFPMRDDGAPRRTLVLLTGDGNMNEGRASFIESVDSALRNGWRVELWSWRASLSQHYLRMRDQYASSGLFSIHFLDEHRETLTFHVAATAAPQPSSSSSGHVANRPLHNHRHPRGRYGHHHHHHHPSGPYHSHRNGATAKKRHNLKHRHKKHNRGQGQPHRSGQGH